MEHMRLHDLTTEAFVTLLSKIAWLLKSNPSYVPRPLRLTAAFRSTGWFFVQAKLGVPCVGRREQAASTCMGHGANVGAV